MSYSFKAELCGEKYIYIYKYISNTEIYIYIYFSKLLEKIQNMALYFNLAKIFLCVR